MIFSTNAQGGLNFLGNSFANISRDINSGYGKFGSIFGGGIKPEEIDSIKKFNYQVKSGVPIGQAWRNTMAGCRTVVKQTAVDVRSGAVTMEELEGATQKGTASMVGATVAATALNVAISMGIALAIQGLITGIQALVGLLPTFENTSKKLDESSQKVKDSQDKIKSLNEELKTTQSRMGELQSKGSLTIVEKNELDKLKQTNAELKTKLTLEEQLLKTNQASNAQNFVSAAKAKTQQDSRRKLFFWEDREDYGKAVDLVYDFYGKTRNNYHSIEDTSGLEGGFLHNNEQTRAFLARIQDYQDITKELNKGKQSYSIQKEGYGAKTYSREELEKEREETKSAMSSYLKDLEATKEKLGDYDYSTLSDEAKKYVDYIEDATNKYNLIIDETGKNSETVFNSIYSSKRFEKGKKAIEALNEAGNLTSDSLESLYNGDTNVKAMIDNMKSVGLIADTSKDTFKTLIGDINNFNSGLNDTSNTAQQAKKSLSDFFTQLNGEKDKNKKLSKEISDGKIGSYIKGLTDKEAQVALYSLQQEKKTSNINLDYLKKSVEGYRKVQKEYDKILQEAMDGGVDLSQTVYGNIDNDNRQILEWNKSNLKKYKGAYKSWGYNKGDLKDTYSTVMGSFDYFNTSTGKAGDTKNGLPIAFSPMLQTSDGAKLLNKKTVDSYIKKLIESANGDLSRTNLLKLDSKGITIEGEKIKNIIADVGESAKKTSESMHFTGNSGAIQDAYNNLKQYVGAMSLIDIKTETTDIKNLNTAISESNKETGLSDDSISNLTKRYSQLSNFKPDKIFERTSGGVQINREELEKFEKQFEDTQKVLINSDLNNLIQEYNALQVQIDNCTDSAQLSNLQSQRDAKYTEIQNTKNLAAEYEALTSAYNKWQTAKSESNEYDKYSNIGSSYKGIKELIEQGWVDDTEVTKYLDLVLNASKRTSDNVKDFSQLTSKIGKTNYSIMDFFQYDDNNKLTTKGLKNFLDAVNKELGEEYVKIDKQGKYTFDFTGKKVEDVAKAFGMSTEAVQIFQNALKGAGFKVTFQDINKEIKSARENAEASIAALTKLQKKGKIKTQVEVDGKTKEVDVSKFDVNSVDMDKINTQIEEATALLEQFKKKDGTVDLKIKGAKDVQNILLTLIANKQQLSKPAVVKLDIKNVKSKYKEAVRAFKEFNDAKNEMFLGEQKGIDTTESQNKLKAAAKKLQNLDVSIKADLKINDKKTAKSLSNISAKVKLKSDDKDIKAINTKIKNINPEDKKIKITTSSKGAKKDLKELHDYQIGDKTFKVLMSGGDDALTKLQGINTQLSKLKDGSITITTQTKTKGKASALGNAFANGKMGTKESGTGLFGELGREILVDPISGTWKTVGDNGAEFVKYRRGSIVFNHRQTEELLKNGKTGRGHAFAHGNAFLTDGGQGSGNFASVGNTKSANKTSDTKTKSVDKSSDKSKTKTKNNNNKSETDKVLQKFKKWFDSLFDWIEVKLTRQTERIDRYVAKAENALKKNNYSSGSKYYRKAINANITQTQNEKTAYSKYIKEGRITLNKAVKGGVISKKEANTIKKKVQNGTFSFDNYNTKHGARVKEIAEDYKKMYDKAVSAKDAVVTLNNNLLEYCEKLYNIPLDKATAKIDKLSNALNVLTARADAVAGGTKVYNKTHVANAKADKTAADKAYKRSVTKTNSAGKSLLKELSGKDKKKAKAKIKSGKKVSTKGLSDKALKKANAYNAAIDAQKVAKQEASDANKAYQNAKTQQEKYQDKKIPFVDALLPNYSYENKILDEETKNSKQQFKANQIAAREASKNATKVNKQLTKTKDKIKNDDTTIKNAKKYFSSKKAQKALTKEQKKALKKGQVMSTKGLRGDALKQAKAYNKAIKEENKLKKEQKKLSTQSKAAKNAETTATQNAAKAEAEYAKTLQQNAKAKLDNVESSYESVRNIISARINNRKSSIDLKKAQGKKVTSSDYGEIRIQASHDTEIAKKALDDYKKVFNANKGNMSAEDINAAQQKIQELEQAWKDAQKAEEDYLSESIQADIDNVQADIDLLKAKNALLSGSEAKNKNINKQISKTRDEYDLMIQQEKNATKQAQLRAEKEKAILDLLKEQVENIKSEQTLWNNWFSAYNNMITSQKGDIAEALGTDTYGSRTSVYLQNALLQSNTAENDRKEAQKLWDNIHTSDWGTYGDDGVFKVWANKYDDWVAYQTDYWNMIADANKAEAQSYTERYNAWQEQYLNPLKNELDKLKIEEEKQNAKINLANAKGLKTTSEQYNTLISVSKLQVSRLEEQNFLLIEQQKLYDPQSKKYKEIQDQIDSNTKSISETAKQQVEWNNAILQLPLNTLDEALSKYDAIKSRLSSFISLQKTLGEDEGAIVYYEQISIWGNKATTSLAQANKALEYATKAEADAEGVYGGKTAQEWRNENEKYLSEYYSNLESQQKARAEYVEYALRSYNKLIDGYEHYETVIKGISELIDEEMYFDKDGKVTSYGITQIASLVSEYETAQNKMGIYSDELKKVNQLYAEGQMTADEYKSKTQELEKNIIDGAKEMKSSISEVIKMYKDMAKTELDALLKLIDARNEALSKKKAYYDFDKTLRKKNKDIESLNSQISALMGIDTAAAKAKRAQLMSDLAEAQEDLQDTIQEHTIQISQDSLKDLKETMQESFDDKWEEISKDLSKQTELWASATTLASGSVNTVNSTLQKLLTYYGVNTSDLPNAHFASGTTGIGKNMMAYLHENGREGIVTKNGILMPLLKGEGVLPADATSRLLAMAKGDMSGFIDLPNIAKTNFGANIPEFTINQDNSITIEGSADAVTVEQLKKLHNDWVRDAADYTDKKIHRDFLKGGGRRTL